MPAVKAIAHITGGGLPGNVGRTIPDWLDAVIEWGSWPRPAVFAPIAQAGVPRQEMLATFNLGIGYTLVVDRDFADSALEFCHENGVEAWVIGSLRPGSGQVIVNE